MPSRFLQFAALPAALALLVGSAAAQRASARSAEAELSHHDDFNAALQAMRDGLPEIAAAKLRRVLEIKNLDADVGHAVRLRLAEAQVWAGQPEQALETIAASGRPADPAAQFWKGQAQSALGQLAEAEATFASIAGGDDGSAAGIPFGPEAVLSRAKVLVMLGDPEAALAALSPLLSAPANPSVDRAHVEDAQLLAARLHLVMGRTALARKLLDPLVTESETPSPDVRFLSAAADLAAERFAEADAALRELMTDPAQLSPAFRYSLPLAAADAAAAMNEPATARQILRDFAAEAPPAPFIERAFRRLFELGAFSGSSGSGTALLDTWIAGDQPALAAAARFYKARAQAAAGALPDAIAGMAAFRAAHANHRLAREAALHLADWHIAAGSPEAAAGLLAEAVSPDAPAPAEIDFLEGQAALADDRPEDAVEKFDAAAEAAGDPREMAAARISHALAALQARDDAEFEAAVMTLDELPSGAPRLRANLHLQRGLYEASRRTAAAAETLNAYLDSYPDGSGRTQARIALAELALLSFPPKTKSARDEIAAARAEAGGQDPAAAERLDYLETWVAEAEGDMDLAIAEGRDFLTRWPQSPRRAALRMKLGEIFFRREDYPNARLQFEQLAAESPGSEFAEAALFFAGRAALMTMAPESLDVAIATWEKVAARGGPFRLHARYQQALAKRRLGADGEAIQIFDSILAALPPPDPMLRFAVLMAKGEALLTAHPEEGSDAAAASKATLAGATAAFDAVIDHPEATPEQQHEALYRKGKALESAGLATEALEAYYDVVNAAADAGPASSADHLWFYRAGFEALRILEGRDPPQWKAAVSIAERLASAGGPRADEARDYAERLKLQHFIW